VHPAQARPVILIVDDDLATTDLLVEFLNEEPGLDARPVTAPEQALALARTVPVNLLVVDLMMPNMSGVQLFEQLQADPVTSKIPALFMTAGRTGDDVAAHTGRMVIQKPFDLDCFLAAVRRALTT
jgi:DNA-binding response OmpR family regulator